MKPLEPLEWVAIIGAFAWLPHLLTFLKKVLTKPEIRVIVGKRAEIGFTTLGNIFNLRLAFSVKNHDTVISELKINITHESGEEKIFEWQGIRQRLFTTTTAQGDYLPSEKEQSVLAIKLNTKDVEERIIQCQEASFIEQKQTIESKVFKKLNYLKEQNKINEIEFLKSEEMSDLYKFIKQSFSWKQGRYNATVNLESPDDFILKDNKYTFTLSALDIENLEKNKEQVEMSFETLKEDKSNEVFWNWRNPSLIKN